MQFYEEPKSLSKGTSQLNVSPPLGLMEDSAAFSHIMSEPSEAVEDSYENRS